VRVPVLDAELQVGHDAKGQGISVSVRDILRQARLTPPETGEDSGGLVILAACLSDVTEADYDEALTLASTFLAAGSTGVVAARWAVTDKLTARFMAAFHLFLAAGNSDVAGALREAQLWMLDPAREVPATWPEWLKRRAPSLAQVEAWAAFTYQGR
jgi:CHAT domain-containing protein